jgi:hypothetical protein
MCPNQQQVCTVALVAGSVTRIPRAMRRVAEVVPVSDRRLQRDCVVMS